MAAELLNGIWSITVELVIKDWFNLVSDKVAVNHETVISTVVVSMVLNLTITVIFTKVSLTELTVVGVVTVNATLARHIRYQVRYQFLYKWTVL